MNSSELPNCFKFSFFTLSRPQCAKIIAFKFENELLMPFGMNFTVTCSTTNPSIFKIFVTSDPLLCLTDDIVESGIVEVVDLSAQHVRRFPTVQYVSFILSQIIWTLCNELDSSKLVLDATRRLIRNINFMLRLFQKFIDLNSIIQEISFNSTSYLLLFSSLTDIYI